MWTFENQKKKMKIEKDRAGPFLGPGDLSSRQAYDVRNLKVCILNKIRSIRYFVCKAVQNGRDKFESD